jgi:basic membrane lipoprotein Med (substrate-binding protein (PBP1-ABC) superfamily)
LVAKTTYYLAIMLIIGVIIGLVIGINIPRGVAPTETITVTVTTTVPQPTVGPLSIAVIYVTPIEEPWNKALHMAMMWAQENLGIKYTYVEKISEADVDRVIRSYVDAGYRIIFPHSWGYWSTTIRVASEFPNVLFCQGSGPTDQPWPNNVVLYDYYIQDAAYLAGYVAGLITQTNKIGVITAFPVADVNNLVNAFIKGAKDANPKVTPYIIYIESWFDPTKAKAAALSLIAEGVDVIYSERFGVEYAADEHYKSTGKRVYVVGNIVNQNEAAPDVVIGSVVWDLRPFVSYIITNYMAGTLKGGIINWTMKEGWSRFVWNFKLLEKGVIPPEVFTKVSIIEQKLITGEIKVEQVWEDPRKIWLTST